MKKFFSLFFVLSFAVLLIPLAALGQENKISALALPASKPETAVLKEIKKFRVLDKKTEKITVYSAKEYICGVVAAEMPALYEVEALKAQAVAAYTFALNKAAVNKDQNYDLTTDHSTDQSFLTKEELKEKWGENADKYIEKIETAVDEVLGFAITYKNSPINAVYHAISFGKTESSQNVWGKDLPYLKSVASEWDMLSENYISEAVFTPEQLQKALEKEVDFNKNPQNYIGKITKTEAGLVKSVEICGKKVKGNTIRAALSLRSSSFDIKYSEGAFAFTVYGYGHGVGMSQNGANYMAKQGSSFKEILSHYYTNCKIEKIG